MGIFFFTTASIRAQGPTQPAILWASGSLTVGVKQPGRDANHSPTSRAEMKKA
jgi:hypothetical protein